VGSRVVLVEALACLLAARFLLAVLPFRRLRRLLERPSKRPALAGEARRRERQQVRRAVFHWHRRLPSLTTCFHRAIAAQLLLRRRGVETTLSYGAARLPGRGLTGHVWLQDGPEPVLGVAAAAGYKILASYPGRHVNEIPTGEAETEGRKERSPEGPRQEDVSLSSRLFTGSPPSGPPHGCRVPGP